MDRIFQELAKKNSREIINDELDTKFGQFIDNELDVVLKNYAMQSINKTPLRNGRKTQERWHRNHTEL